MKYPQQAATNMLLEIKMIQIIKKKSKFLLNSN